MAKRKPPIVRKPPIRRRGSRTPRGPWDLIPTADERRSMDASRRRYDKENGIIMAELVEQPKAVKRMMSRRGGAKSKTKWVNG